MKRNRIIGAVLALGILAGAGFGFKALASSNTNTPFNQNTQTQGQYYRGGMMGNYGTNYNGGFGGMMGNYGTNNNGGFGGFGGMMNGIRGWFGGQGTQITTDQQKQLTTLRAEMQNVMIDYQQKMTDAHNKLNTAIQSGVKSDILTAWEELKTLQDEVQSKIKPYTDQLTGILGTDQDYQNFMNTNFENSYLYQKMDALKNAATDADSTKIIDELKNGTGAGFGGFGMMRRGGFGGGFGGFGGGCGRGFRR